MSSLGEQGYPANTALNLGLSIWTSFSIVPGSPSLAYIQPLLTGKVFASTAVLIGAELFLFLAQHFFGLEGVPILCPGSKIENPIIKIPIPELQELLGAFSKFSANDNATVLKNPQTSSYTLPNHSIGSFLSTQTSDILTSDILVIALSVFVYYSNEPFAPSIFFSLPIITLPGIRGALPLLIVGILGTIFVRSVVPPETTGAKPLKKIISSDPKPMQFNAEDLMKLLIRFGKYFGSQ